MTERKQKKGIKFKNKKKNYIYTHIIKQDLILMKCVFNFNCKKLIGAEPH